MLVWYYQFTPHDVMDYVATQVHVLADINWRGSPTQAMLWANLYGLMYVLDSTSGKFLFGKPFVLLNWMDSFDAICRQQRVAVMLQS
jgi:alcohol dehydrogenase (cytochrome c)